MSKNNGFTLIELLVVVGIIAILAIAALIAINPIEAQRRSRDGARLQDMARLTAAVEAFINDNGMQGSALGTLTAGTSLGDGQIRSQPCAAGNWMTVDLCDYLKQVPLDPLNDRQSPALTTIAGVRASRLFGYGFAVNVNTGNYELRTYLESDKSIELLSDGGTAAQVDNFETGVGTNAAGMDCGI